MSAEAEIRDFLLGNTDIVAFRERYDTDEEINNFLQGIVDDRIASVKSSSLKRGIPVGFNPLIGQ